MKSFVLLAVFSVLLAKNEARYVRSLPEFAGKEQAGIEAQVSEWMARGLPEILEFPSGRGESTIGLITYPPKQSPATVKDFVNDVHFYVFTRKNVDGTKVQLDKEQMQAAGLEYGKKTVVVIHGFSNDINSEIIQKIKNNILNRYDYNVIGVDWSVLCPPPFYITARTNVMGTGKRIATAVDYLVNNEMTRLEDIHIIGHSLGAHVAGTAGKFVSVGELPRVTGLDPAMPLFLILDEDRLAKSDGKVVDVIHTNAGLLGYPDRLGDADFFPNGGVSQPGCGVDITGVCSHARSHQLFSESIVMDRVFESTLCKSTDEAIQGNCNENGTGTMGYHLRFDVEGPYYLETAAHSPFNLVTHKN